MRRRLCRLFIHLALIAFTGVAYAEGPLGPDGSRLRTSDYAVDVTRGPVLSGTRVTGLAGAYSAIAEGVQGGLSNPAAVALRFPASVDFWDYDLSFSFTYPIQNGDFFNSGNYLKSRGTVSKRAFYFLNPGLYVQLFQWGFGAVMDIQQLNVQARAPTVAGANRRVQSELRLFVATTHLQFGARLFKGQLAVGGGLEVLRLTASAAPTGGTRIVTVPGFPPSPFSRQARIYAQYGFGGELGVLWRPNWKSWRLGAGLYTRAQTNTGSSQDRVAFGYYLPRYAVRPWQGSLAFAYQFGGRPFNPKFVYVEEAARVPLAQIKARKQLATRAHHARLSELRRTAGVDYATQLEEEERLYAEEMTLYEAEEAAVRQATWNELRGRVRSVWPRRYLLVTTEIAFVGRVHNAVGSESFLVGVTQHSGEHVSVSPRLGLESEVWPLWLKMRAGTYVEPSRVRESDARVHGTFGFDARIGRWTVFGIWPDDYQWQLSAAYDVTRDYHALSVSIGGWY